MGGGREVKESERRWWGRGHHHGYFLCTHVGRGGGGSAKFVTIYTDRDTGKASPGANDRDIEQNSNKKKRGRNSLN